MPFAWDDYLKLAQQLVVQHNEADKRTAISRAYYFAYKTAHTRAVKNGVKFQGSGRHAQCWKCYKKGPDVTAKQIGLDGERLHHQRIQADYYDVFPKVDQVATIAVAAADKFKKDLAGLATAYPLP